MTNGRLQQPIETLTEWIRLYRSVSVAGLPGRERRALLDHVAGSPGDRGVLEE